MIKKYVGDLCGQVGGCFLLDIVKMLFTETLVKKCGYKTMNLKLENKVCDDNVGISVHGSLVNKEVDLLRENILGNPSVVEWWENLTPPLPLVMLSMAHKMLTN